MQGIIRTVRKSIEAVPKCSIAPRWRGVFHCPSGLTLFRGLASVPHSGKPAAITHSTPSIPVKSIPTSAKGTIQPNVKLNHTAKGAEKVNVSSQKPLPRTAPAKKQPSSTSPKKGVKFAGRTINDAIPYAQMTLIDQHGIREPDVVTLSDALARRPPGHDLVLLSTSTSPPLCKYMSSARPNPAEVIDASFKPVKHKKKSPAPASGGHKVTVKKVRIGLTISSHDLERKLKGAEEFLAKSKSSSTIISSLR